MQLQPAGQFLWTPPKALPGRRSQPASQERQALAGAVGAHRLRGLCGREYWQYRLACWADYPGCSRPPTGIAVHGVARSFVHVLGGINLLLLVLAGWPSLSSAFSAQSAGQPGPEPPPFCRPNSRRPASATTGHRLTSVFGGYSAVTRQNRSR